MLEQNILEQLKSVFSKLKNEVSLVYYSSTHPKQGELEALLNDLKSTSSMIKIQKLEIERSIPSFFIKYKEKENGINFEGIPLGHEFSSLVLAILNSDYEGKFPDEFIIDKIKNIKGDVEIRTFISLSCENCPEVIQALNLIAILNGSIKHTMLDGEYFGDEIDRLKIQGVPAVFIGDELIHAGKSNISELLNKLENRLGKKTESIFEKKLGHFDVVVIGAGPAGASAAIYTARKGLKTAIVAEKVGGQVKDTIGIENLISVPYTEGPILASKLLEHIKAYDIKLFEHRKIEEITSGELNLITLNSKELIEAKRIIVATGAKWRELNIPGEKEFIGRGVAFCPHCDGPFYKGKKVAVVGGGNSGVEAAIDLSKIVSEVTLFEFQEFLKADSVLQDKLRSLPNVKIITNAKTERVLHSTDKVIGIEYLNRKTNEKIQVELDGIFVQIGLAPNSSFINKIVETNKMGEIIVDYKNKTSKSGIYAAGDVTNIPYKQIIISMGDGAKAGLSVFEDLVYST